MANHQQEVKGPGLEEARGAGGDDGKVERLFEALKQSIQAASCTQRDAKSCSHSSLAANVVPGEFAADEDRVDYRLFKKMEAKSSIDVISRYQEAVEEVKKKKGGVVERILSLEQQTGSSARPSSSVLLSKVFTKAFELRQNKSGKYREHAFLLEELGKDICRKSQGDGSRTINILAPAVQSMADEDLHNALVPDPALQQDLQPLVEEGAKAAGDAFETTGSSNRLRKICKVSNIDKVVEFLLQMSGQATIYDKCQRGDELSEFGKAYLRKALQEDLLEERQDLQLAEPAMEGRIDELDQMAQRALQDSLQNNQKTNLFMNVSKDQPNAWPASSNLDQGATKCDPRVNFFEIFEPSVGEQPWTGASAARTSSLLQPHPNAHSRSTVDGLGFESREGLRTIDIASSPFFTQFNTNSFYNPSLNKQATQALFDQDGQAERREQRLRLIKSKQTGTPASTADSDGLSQFAKLIHSEIAPVNRFNVTLMGMDREEHMLGDFESRDTQTLAGPASAQLKLSNSGFFQDEAGPQAGQAREKMMGTFQNRLRPMDGHASDRGYQNPFNVDLELPPLPTLASSTLLDPSNKQKGEKLITKTFFSFGPAQASSENAEEKAHNFLSIKERKVTSSVFKENKDGLFELKNGDLMAPKVASRQHAGADSAAISKRFSKQALKDNQRSRATAKKRKQLLMSLLPYVDESKLVGNVAAESAMQSLWEDEHLNYSLNNLQLNESGLLTPQKQISFKRMLSQFQNSLIVPKDAVTGKDNESIVQSEAELVDKALLLLQGIPSAGVFDLDQETFTFSMNGNKRVYVIVEDTSMFAQRSMSQQSAQPGRPAKLAVNQELFQEMMEAGSYFLHLNEFVACMSNAENAQSEESQPVGKILQAFSLSVADFLSFYQSQIIDFPNKVQTRRKFEDALIFNRQGVADVKSAEAVQDSESSPSSACPPTLLDLLTHLSPLLTQLKLLATICFTKKFIDNIIEVKKREQRQMQMEMGEGQEEHERFQKFQMLLYAGKGQGQDGDGKFTVKNLQKEFQHNLEKIRNEQWLGEFPRGAHLLTYLYKILMCCESDLQAVHLLRDIFRKTMQPLLEMIDDFIYRGTFDDPFEEFFIEKLPDERHPGKESAEVVQPLVMQHTYKLSQRAEIVPEFIGIKIAEAIFKIGSHINLLQVHDQEQMFSQPDPWQSETVTSYAKDICDISKVQQLESRQPAQQPLALDTILDGNGQHRIALTFSLPHLTALNTELTALCQSQLAHLQKLEHGIIGQEQRHIQNLIREKQKAAEKYQQERERKLKEKWAARRQEKELQMKMIQASLAEAKAKKQLEAEQARLEMEEELEEQRQIEEIKAAIAEELKKQYKRVVEGEVQILGDIRDWEVREVERERQEIDREIEEGQKRRQQIEKEIGDNEQIDKAGPPKDSVSQGASEVADVAMRDESAGEQFASGKGPGKGSEADVGPGSESTATLKDALALGDIKLEVSEGSDAKRTLTAEEIEQSKRERLEIEHWVVRQFIRPLMKNVWATIDEARRAEHRRRIYNLRKEEQQIKNAQLKKMTHHANALHSNISDRLKQTFDMYTNDKEKIEMSESTSAEAAGSAGGPLVPAAQGLSKEQPGLVPLTVDSTQRNVDVPVHLAMDQCVINSIKQQFKIVNKCMLHMMYRKLNLLNHLKALKMFFFSGQGDVMEQFVAQLFHNDAECTVKDNSLFFINNSYEFALRQTLQSAGVSQGAPGGGRDDEISFGGLDGRTGKNNETVHLSGSPASYHANLEFAFINVKDQMSKSRVGGPNKLRAPVLLMNLHTIEDHVTLRYKRKSPLDLVLTDQSIVKYNRIFFTLLKLKKVLQLLKECWKELNQRAFKNLRGQSEKVRARQLLLWRLKMQGFMHTFAEYLLIDTIEAAWQWLHKTMQTVQAFEQLQQLHNSEYLDARILDRSLMGRKESKVAQFMTEILICVQKFVAKVKASAVDMVTGYDEDGWAEVTALADQFQEQSSFFAKFVEQLSNKGFYRELNARLISQHK